MTTDNIPPHSASNPANPTGRPMGSVAPPGAGGGRRGGRNEGTAPGVPGAGRPGPAGRSRRRTAVRAAVLVVLAALVVVAGIAAWGLRRLNDISFVDVAGVEPSGGPVNNWLLIGTDGREGIDPDAPDAGAFLGEEVVGKRTDTIMLARVDSRAGTVDVLSIPRDLWVPIAGGTGNGRINGAYNGDGGRERLVATLSEALGVEINHYAEVNFVGFREIVDALEGVPLWFDHPARDAGSGLHIVEAGCHIVDGRQALAFARARNYEEFVDGVWRVDPTGDLGRTTRQRVFLTRTIDTAIDKLAVTSLGTVDEVLTVGGRNLVIEDGASIGDLISLARTFAAVGGDRIVGHSLPVDDHRTAEGAQVLRLREVEAGPTLEVFRTGAISSGPSAGDAGLDAGPASGTGQPEADGDPADAADAAGEVGADEADFEAGAEGTGGGQVRDGYGRFGFTASPTPEGTPCQ